MFAIVKLCRICIVAFAVLVVATNSNSVEALDPQQVRAGNFWDRYTVGSEVILVQDAVEKRITEIGQRIARGSGIPNRFRFRVLNSPAVNAHALPAGFIYIHSGLMDVVDTEDELAAVIAHEMVHSIERHFINKWDTYYLEHHDKAVAAAIFGIIISPVFQVAGVYFQPSTDPNVLIRLAENAPTILATYAAATITIISFKVATQLAAELNYNGYRQNQELEADRKATGLLESAGYDKRAMIGFLKRLNYLEQKALGLQKNRYLSHFVAAKPGLRKRIGELEALIGAE